MAKRPFFEILRMSQISSAGSRSISRRVKALAVTGDRVERQWSNVFRKSGLSVNFRRSVDQGIGARVSRQCPVHSPVLSKRSNSALSLVFGSSSQGMIDERYRSISFCFRISKSQLRSQLTLAKGLCN